MKLQHTTWNNLAGSPGLRRLGPVTIWKRPFGRFYMQIVVRLRPFRLGRKSHYLRIVLGEPRGH